MDEINKNMQTPGINQINKSGRDIYYKEHEFKSEYQLIIAELDALLDESASSTSIIVAKRKEIISLLANHENEMNNVSMVSDTKIQLILTELINVDSAHERLYKKILKDIENINSNTQNRSQVYDIPSTYNTSLKEWIFNHYGKKSPYKSGIVDNSNNDNWTIKNPHSSILLRDIDSGDRMITFPFVLDPNISQDSYVKIFSFTPLINNSEPRFLVELAINGDLYAFRGYLKSECIDRSNTRKAIFHSDYAVSYEIPFSFKVVYDDIGNKIIVLFKYINTINKYTSIMKMNISVHLLAGKNLEIEELNTIFSEPIAV
jgi:hypothetical protein